MCIPAFLWARVTLASAVGAVPEDTKQQEDYNLPPHASPSSMPDSSRYGIFITCVLLQQAASNTQPLLFSCRVQQVQPSCCNQGSCIIASLSYARAALLHSFGCSSLQEISQVSQIASGSVRGMTEGPLWLELHGNQFAYTAETSTEPSLTCISVDL